MSSKRKKRQAEWEKREEKRRTKELEGLRRRSAMASGNIERMAEALGVRLR